MISLTGIHRVASTESIKNRGKMMGLLIAVLALANSVAQGPDVTVDQPISAGVASSEAYDPGEEARAFAEQAVGQMIAEGKQREARLAFCQTVPGMDGDWTAEIDRQNARGVPLGDKAGVAELCMFYLEGYVDQLEKRARERY